MTTSTSALGKHVREHGALAGAIAGFLVAGVRLLVLSHGEAASAGVIVGKIGVQVLVVGVALSLIPMGLLLAGAILITALWGSASAHPRLWAGAWVAAAAGALGCPVGFGLFVAFLVALMLIVRRPNQTPVSGPFSTAFIAFVAVLATAGSLLSVAWDPAPLPEEQVQRRSEGPVEGYVLDTSDGWLTILRSDNGQILTLSSQEVSSRVSVEPPHTRSITTLEFLQSPALGHLTWLLT